MANKTKIGLLGHITKAILDYTGIDISPTAVSRRIVDMGDWSGSPSNYSSTEAYCRSCLIDVNDAAGRDVKVQSHCKLPIRTEYDGDGTYVRQAVYAASGGRGITRVTKPDDVSDDDWEDAVESAAMQLVIAYEEMDEMAPESVYELADMEFPEETMSMRYVLSTLSDISKLTAKERATAINALWSQVWTILQNEAGYNEWGEMNYENFYYPHDFYLDAGVLFLILSKDGKLYRRDVTILDGVAVLGNPVQVFETFIPTMNQENRTLISVKRQADGRYRGVLLASTAVLNRVGEIDSTRLHDSFIVNAQETGLYPIITVWHLGDKARIGQADYLARDGACYLATFLFDDTEFGRAAAEGIAKEPSYWGSSIEFFASEAEMLRIGNVDIPVFTKGVNPAITILAENRAASLFTATFMEREMDKRIKQDLVRLFGDEDLADSFAEIIDGANEKIRNNNLITRTAAGQATESADSVSEAGTPTTTAGVNRDIELDDEFVAQVARTFATTTEFRQFMDGYTARLAAIETSLASFITTTNTVVASLATRMIEIDNQAEGGAQRRRNDMPTKAEQRQRVTYRPTINGAVSNTPPAKTATSALSKVPAYKGGNTNGY